MVAAGEVYARLAREFSQFYARLAREFSQRWRAWAAGLCSLADAAWFYATQDSCAPRNAFRVSDEKSFGLLLGILLRLRLAARVRLTGVTFG